MYEISILVIRLIGGRKSKEAETATGNSPAAGNRLSRYHFLTAKEVLRMVLVTRRFWAALVLGCLLLLATAAIAADKPAIVLVAFGTSTKAFETYKYFEDKVKERFPDHEIRWAYTSKIVREKLKEEQQRELPDLTQTLEDLKAKGVTQVAVQSLHVVPGEEWEKKVKICQETPGLKIALGKPLLSSLSDRQRVLQALAKDFPADFKENAVLLVGHGSPSPAGMQGISLLVHPDAFQVKREKCLFRGDRRPTGTEKRPGGNKKILGQQGDDSAVPLRRRRSL